MNQYAKVSHVGLDHHRRFGRLTARDAGNRVLFRERLEYGDREKLGQRLRQFPARTPVIVEGTFAWGWLCDVLKEANLEPHLSSSRKVAAWREARGISKSNRIDADFLSELWPQQPRWWEVWLAPPEVRDRRELLRCRMALVAVQTMTKNRIHATLHRHGVLHDYSDLFGVAGRRFLRALAGEDSPLREMGRVTLREYLTLLDQVRRQIVRVTLRVRKLVTGDEQAELWKSLPGVGTLLAWTIRCEVGDPWRFPDGRHLASYSLLAPLSDDTGEEDGSAPLGRHVGWSGRLTLKWAFIEAARGAARKDARFREAFNRRTEEGKKDRNRGHIAVARKLCDVGLACVKKKRPYTPTPPPRPGARPPPVSATVSDSTVSNATVSNATVSNATVATATVSDATVISSVSVLDTKEMKPRKTRRASARNKQRTFRPGMGQPDHPMAVADTRGVRA